MATVAEKLLPQSAEMERATLGSVLCAAEIGLANRVLAAVRPFLEPDAFYTENHRLIYAAMRDLYDASEPVDVLTVCDELSRRGHLDTVGGASEVSALANQVPTHLHAERYARIVADKAILRRLIQVAGQIAAVAYNDPDADTALDEACKLVLGVASRGTAPEDGFQPMSVALHEAWAEMLRRSTADTPPGIATGLPELDAAIGPIEPTDLVLITGRPGSLKSQLGAKLATEETYRRMDEGAGTVAWVTLEMSGAQQARRLLAESARVNSRLLRRGFRLPDGGLAVSARDATRAAYHHLLKALGDRLRFKAGVASLESIRTLMIREKLEHDTRLLVVDQFDLIGIDERSPRYHSELDRLNAYSRGLKTLGMELEIPVVVLVQLNRESVKANQIDLSHLAGTDRLGRDANTVIAVRRPAASDKERAARERVFREFLELTVLKARDSESNVIVGVKAEPQFSRIETWPYGGEESWPDDENRQGHAMRDDGTTAAEPAPAW